MGETGASSGPEGPHDRGAQVLAAVGAAGLAAAGVTAVIVLVVSGPGWFSAARIAGFLAVIAFSAAFFSAAAGRRSAAASAASATTARRAYGQQLYELARATHADLTTGEVAAARDRLGALVRARRALHTPETRGRAVSEQTMRNAYDPWPPGGRMDQARRDWFTLLWCFQRLQAALVLLAEAPPEIAHGRQQTPRDFLAALVREQVRFLNVDATHIRAALEEFYGHPVDDRESTETFRDLVAELLPEAAAGRWADPVSTQFGDALRTLLLATPGFCLGDLSDTQFLALHQSVHLPDGSRLPERADFGARLRREAEQAQAEQLQRAVAARESVADHGHGAAHRAAQGTGTESHDAAANPDGLSGADGRAVLGPARLWERAQAIENFAPATPEVPEP